MYTNALKRSNCWFYKKKSQRFKTVIIYSTARCILVVPEVSNIRDKIYIYIAEISNNEKKQKKTPYFNYVYSEAGEGGGE